MRAGKNPTSSGTICRSPHLTRAFREMNGKGMKNLTFILPQAARKPFVASPPPSSLAGIAESTRTTPQGRMSDREIDQQLVEKIKEAFFNFPWEGSGLASEFKKEGKFVPIEYKKDWAVLRKIDEANGVKYTCK